MSAAVVVTIVLFVGLLVGLWVLVRGESFASPPADDGPSTEAQERVMLAKREHDHLADWERRFREECGLPPCQAPPALGPAEPQRPTDAVETMGAHERRRYWESLSPTQWDAYRYGDPNPNHTFSSYGPGGQYPQKLLDVPALPPPPDPNDMLLRPVTAWDTTLLIAAWKLHEARFGPESFDNFLAWLDQKRIQALARRVHDGSTTDATPTVEIQRSPDPAGGPADRIEIKSGRDVIAVW